MTKRKVSKLTNDQVVTAFTFLTAPYKPKKKEAKSA